MSDALKDARFLRKMHDRMAYVGTARVSSPTITLYALRAEEAELDLFLSGAIKCIGCFREWPLEHLYQGEKDQHYPPSGEGVLFTDGIPCTKNESPTRITEDSNA